MLFLGGCEDLNTTCSKDINDSNSSDTNCSDINCTDYCSTIDWSDINNSDTSCLSYCDCKPEPVIDCEKDEYKYCKIIIDDQNNSDFLCSDDLGFNPTCNFSGCDCNDIDYNHSEGIVGFGCTCPGSSNPIDPDDGNGTDSCNQSSYSSCICYSCDSNETVDANLSDDDCQICNCNDTNNNLCPLDDFKCSSCQSSNDNNTTYDCATCKDLSFVDSLGDTSHNYLAGEPFGNTSNDNKKIDSDGDNDKSCDDGENDSYRGENSDVGSRDYDNDDNKNKTYIMHTDIKVGLFWIRGKDENNDTIQKSAWDSGWLNHYGGIDTPDSRNGYNPASFTPNENPFYVALPYNDLAQDGERKYGSDNYIPWAGENDDPFESICKNRWVKIIANNNIAYAQWEDVGPYGNGTDINYVFGGKKPLNSTDTNSYGMAISPAVRDYLLGSGSDVNTTNVNWVFVEESNVIKGPWLDKTTDSPSRPDR